MFDTHDNFFVNLMCLHAVLYYSAFEYSRDLQPQNLAVKKGSDDNILENLCVIS